MSIQIKGHTLLCVASSKGGEYVNAVNFKDKKFFHLSAITIFMVFSDTHYFNRK